MNIKLGQARKLARYVLLGVGIAFNSVASKAATPDKRAPASLPDSVGPMTRPINGQETQVNRYTTISNVPDESDEFPLAVTAKIHFPRGYVTTVGDAIKYLLIRTGYELAPTAQMDDYVRRVFELRLPESNRVMGPYRVDAMLQALMGPAFSLNVDQSLRLVSYLTKSGSTAVGRAVPPVDTTLNKPDGSSVIRAEPQQVGSDAVSDKATQKVAASQNTTQP